MSNHCLPCRKGDPVISRDEAKQRLGALPGWELSADAAAIAKRWRFENFADALAFVLKVAALAEAENHHPEIALGWGYATLTFTTHATGGLHANDFIMAGLVEG